MDTAALLKGKGLRATPRRMSLVAALEKMKGPATAEELHTKVAADLVTVYRNLQNLVDAGIAREVRFKDASARYELAHGGHHHHLVCTSCGAVDELPACDMKALERNALAASTRFAAIQEHALEFFGTCVACAAR